METPDIPSLPTPEKQKHNPIKIRTHKNPERGTILTYATISVGEALALKKEDLTETLQTFYGNEVDWHSVYRELSTFTSRFDPAHTKESHAIFGHDPTPPQEKLISFEGGRNKTIPGDGDKISNNLINKKHQHYLFLKKIGNRILIVPSPAIHNLLGYKSENESGVPLAKQLKLTQFNDLLDILRNGFYSSPVRKKAFITLDPNSYIKKSKNHRINLLFGLEHVSLKNEGITRGDVFALEIFPQKGYPTDETTERNERIYAQKEGVRDTDYDPTVSAYRITDADPENIVAVNIQIFADATPDQKEEKMRFYRKQLSPFKIPVRFFELTNLSNEDPRIKRIFPKKSMPQTD